MKVESQEMTNFGDHPVDFRELTENVTITRTKGILPLRIQSNQVKQLFHSRSLDMKLSVANSKIRAPAIVFYLASHLRHEILLTVQRCIFLSPHFHLLQ